MQMKCPYCEEVCETDFEPVIGQHLICPYCGEKFSYPDNAKECESAKVLPIPKRHGYVFEGWYTKPRGGAPISWVGIKKDDTRLYQYIIRT